MAYATVTLTGTYQTPDGTPHKGHVEIIPSERVIKDTTGDIILTGRVKVDLDAQGAFSVALPATDDDTLNPTGFGYTIAAKLHSSHPPAVSFSLPASLGATTVEDLTPVDPSTFEATATYAEKSELDAVAATIPSTAADVNALPDTTQIPSTAADVGALPDTTVIPSTPSDIGAEPAGLSQTTSDALSATYVPHGSRGNTTIGFGDSITAWADVTNQLRIAYEGSWFSKACFLSNQRMRFYRNAGVSGNTTTQMLARIDADVIAHAPAKCTVLGGNNDIGGGVPLATIKANLTEIVDRLIAAGIEPIMCTIPPYGATGREQKIGALNAWIHTFAARRGIHVFDFYTVLADPTTGLYKSGTNVDNAHPSEYGMKLMAQHAADNLPESFARVEPYLTVSKADPNNLLTNGLFLGDADADGVADSWGKAGTSTRSLVPAPVGNWQQSQATTTGWAYQSQNVTTGWSVGDRLAFAARLQVENTSGAMNPSLRIVFTGSSDPMSFDPMAFWKQNWEDGVTYAEATIPPGTTAIQMQMSTNNGTGVFRMAQATLLNLTTLGIPGGGFDEARSFNT